MLALERAPRPLADTELRTWTAVPIADLRECLASLTLGGMIECEIRTTYGYRGAAWTNPFYRPAGSTLPWPGSPPAEVLPPDPTALPALTDDEERVLAAALLVADAAGRLNLRPLRDAAGLSEARARRAVSQLRRLGGWPYHWRHAAMPDDEAERRIALARQVKTAKHGESIAEGEFDEVYGEGVYAGDA